MKSKQCILRRGDAVMTSWIPERYAVKGKVLKLKDRETKVWRDGWVVESVGLVEDYEVVCARANSHTKMKEVTDI